MKGGRKKRRKRYCSTIICNNTQFRLIFVEGEPPRTGSLYIFGSTVIFNLPFKIILAIVQFIKAQFFTPFFTNLLFWAHWANIPYIFRFELQIETLHIYIYING